MKVTMIKTQEAIPMGEYEKTSVDKEKETADILIKAVNGGTYTIVCFDDVKIPLFRGTKAYATPNTYEVTESALSKLKKLFNIIPDF